MGLAELVSEITAAADAEAKQIRAAADAEAKEILGSAQAEAEQIKAKWADRAAEDAEAQRRRILASSELEAKKLRLAAEADALHSVRTAVEGRLRALPADERTSITRALVKAAGITTGRAWVRPDDAQLAKELGFEVAGDLKGIAGLVVEDPSGETREDLRFETVLDDAWRAAVKDVATILFGK